MCGGGEITIGSKRFTGIGNLRKVRWTDKICSETDYGGITDFAGEALAASVSTGDFKLYKTAQAVINVRCHHDSERKRYRALTYEVCNVFNNYCRQSFLVIHLISRSFHAIEPAVGLQEDPFRVFIVWTIFYTACPLCIFDKSTLVSWLKQSFWQGLG